MDARKYDPSHPDAVPFGKFFIDCIVICAKDNIGPDEYVWDIYNPGIWLDKFNSGMSACDAVNSVFRAN